jgi:hypothetical protein
MEIDEVEQALNRRKQRVLQASGWTSLPADPSRGEQEQTKGVASPRNHLCARHHRVARIERPFGFGGEPVTTPPLGDLISVALPTISTLDGCLGGGPDLH